MAENKDDPSKKPSDDLRAITEKLEEERNQRINKTFEERKAIFDDIAKTAKTVEEAQERTKEAVEEQSKVLTDIDERINNINENYDKIVDAEQILKEAEEERLKTLQEQYKLNQKNYLNLLDKLKAEKDPERKKILEKELEILLAKIKAQGQELKNDQDSKKGKEALLSISKELLDVFLKQEAAFVQMYKLTGGMNAEITEASKIIASNTLASGVTIEQGQQALINLAQGMNNLRAYGTQAAAAMGETAAYMEKVGISGATAGKSFDTLVNAMGKTPAQATKIQESFVQMSAKNKMALNSVTEAFANNASRFVGYGNEMTKVLDGLAQQAMKTGMKIDSLINIAQGFDTFEDASRKAGTLNALLGDQFNAIELLTASDEERIRLLQEGFKASGKQWESLNRYEKQAIAAAAGIRDLNEAGKILGNTTEKNTALEQDAAAMKKTLEEQALAASVTTDKLKSTLNGLMVILEPLITTLMNLVNILAKGVKAFHDFLGGGEAASLAISIMALAFWKGSGLITKSLSFVMGQMGKFGGVLGKFGSMLSRTVMGAPTIAQVATLRVSSASIGETISSFFSGLSKNFPRILLGLVAAALIGLVLIGLVKALSLFGDIKFDEVLKGLGLLTAVFLAIMGLGAILSSGVAFAAFGLGIIAFGALALALAILGAALMPLAKGLQGIADAFAKLTEISGKFGEVSKNIGTFVIDIAKIETDKIDNFSKSILNLAQAISQLNVSVSAMSTLKDFETKFTSAIKFQQVMEGAPVTPATVPPPEVGFPAREGENKFVAAFLDSMGIQRTEPEAIQQATARAAAAQTAPRTGTSPAVPAQTTVVPLIVQIDKTKIIEILKEDIEKISTGSGVSLLETAGLTQSAFYIQNRVGSQTSGQK